MADKIFGGKNFSANKIFGSKNNFRHFCPPRFFVTFCIDVFVQVTNSQFSNFFTCAILKGRIYEKVEKLCSPNSLNCYMEHISRCRISFWSRNKYLIRILTHEWCFVFKKNEKKNSERLQKYVFSKNIELEK